MSGWIVETLAASTLLMLGVLMLRGPVSRVFGTRVAYALWLLPAVRMILPPLPHSLIAPPMASLPHGLRLDAADLQALVAATVPAAPAPDPVAWETILLATWLTGAALHFGWHLFAYRRFVRRTLSGARQLPLLDRDGVEVCASSSAGSPFATGIFRKAIVLPVDYRRRYTQDELRLAMAHELAHHRRCDMTSNLLALATLSLHWFNPIAHRAHRAFRVDQELACDAIILSSASPTDRHSYGAALLKSACDRLPVAACALGAGDDLKRRLKMMTHKGPSRMQLRIGAAMATVMVSGGLLLTASGGIAAETSRKVERRVQTVMIHNGIVTERLATPAEVASADRAETAAWHASRQAAHAERVAHAVPPQPPEPPEATSAPEPPAPSEPPAPPAPPSELAHDVAEAMQEARREIAAAQREAAAEMRAAAIERMHDQAEARATMIEALTSAREELARDEVETAGRRARMTALASIDRQLAALKSR